MDRSWRLLDGQAMLRVFIGGRFPVQNEVGSGKQLKAE
jgi:hypothetical protein